MTTPQVPEGEMAVRLSVNCPVRTGTRASYVGGTENAISKITMICFDKDGKFILARDAATLTPATATTGPISASQSGTYASGGQFRRTGYVRLCYGIS